jgi:hypothetical protein
MIHGSTLLTFISSVWLPPADATAMPQAWSVGINYLTWPAPTGMSFSAMRLERRATLESGTPVSSAARFHADGQTLRNAFVLLKLAIVSYAGLL